MPFPRLLIIFERTHIFTPNYLQRAKLAKIGKKGSSFRELQEWFFRKSKVLGSWADKMEKVSNGLSSLSLSGWAKPVLGQLIRQPQTDTRGAK